ncbi:MAG: Cna B-type domain-containing protein, partial [Eggerthellaceae bacterium]|nr:Cna B-type domain-containing protein [Eggerthellaceae bacterium]
MVEDGATFNLDGGSISNNYLNTSPDDAYIESAAVYVSSENSHGYGESLFTMNGGSIANNQGRGVLVGSVDSVQYDDVARFVMNGGTIEGNRLVDVPVANDGWTASDNHGNYGAGVRLDSGQFLLHGGTIRNNYADNGGGIAVTPRISIDAPIVFRMDESAGPVLITGNHANTSGGGLHIGTVLGEKQAGEIDALITSGVIENNSAGFQGGGIYVHSGTTAYFENTIDTDNTAVMGGGIWACPSGFVNMFVTNGGAVYGNTAGADNADTAGAGADIVLLQPIRAGTATELSERALGGGAAVYYPDGNVSTESYFFGTITEDSTRYDAANPGQRVFGILEFDEPYMAKVLRSVFSDNTITLANDRARVYIRNNDGYLGGGIGTNGGIVIGAPDEYVLKVSKAWLNWPEDVDQEAEIALVIHDDVRGNLTMDSVTLTKDNPVGIFSDLPAGTYSALEVNVPEGVLFTLLDDPAKLSGENPEAVVAASNEYSEFIDIPVRKLWTDEGADIAKHPSAVSVRLFADDVEVASCELTAEGDWQGVFEHLSVYRPTGAAIAYSVKEDPVPMYFYTAEGTARDGFTITNTPILLSIPVSKAWVGDDPQALPGAVVATLRNAQGTAVAEATLTAVSD